MEGSPIDARELADRLWQQARSAENANIQGYVPELPVLPRLQHMPELLYLNLHWVLNTAYERPTGRMAWVRRKIKGVVARFVFSVLGGYLDDERELLSHLVRLENELVRRIEGLQEETRFLAQAMQAESHRLSERTDVLHRLLEKRFEEGDAKQKAGPV